MNPGGPKINIRYAAVNGRTRTRLSTAPDPREWTWTLAPSCPYLVLMSEKVGRLHDMTSSVGRLRVAEWGDLARLHASLRQKR